MNKTKYLALAFAALTLGACTSDDVVVNDDPNIAQGGEKGYVSLAINLPTQPSTRATEDNSATLDDGDACEYHVNDATLLLFVGSAEESAKFSGAYNLTGSNVTDLDDDHITSTYTYVSQITKPTTQKGENIYALAVLNKSNILTNTNGTWKVGTVTLTAGSTTFTQMNAAMTLTEEQQAAIANREGENFLMTNAPLYTKVGGTADPTSAPSGKLQTLVVVDPTMIKTTEEDAKNNPAAEIYVERAVAKVTVNKDNVSTTVKPDGVTSVEVVGWTLDVTNNKTFFVRDAFEAEWWGYNANTPNTYRFVGNTALETGVSLYRTYWAYDPNYDGEGYTTNGDVTAGNTDFTSINGVPTELNEKFGEENPLYCLENTFNTANMRKDQTTRVIVAVKLGVTGADATNGDFFILNGVRGTYYNKTGIETLIKNAYIAAIDSYLKAKDTGLKSGSENELTGDDIYVSFVKGTASSDVEMGNLKGGTYTLSQVYVKDAAAKKFKKESVPTGIASNNATITNSLKETYSSITYYQGGIAYYPVIIQHFDNKNETAAWSESMVVGGNSYPGTDAGQKWLGRYGVLRNNWYDISVTAVRDFGSPDVTPGTGYDDPPASFMSVEINILSWAKRSQDVHL